MQLSGCELLLSRLGDGGVRKTLIQIIGKEVRNFITGAHRPLSPHVSTITSISRAVATQDKKLAAVLIFRNSAAKAQLIVGAHEVALRDPPAFHQLAEHTKLTKVKRDVDDLRAARNATESIGRNCNLDNRINTCLLVKAVVEALRQAVTSSRCSSMLDRFGRTGKLNQQGSSWFKYDGRSPAYVS